MAQDCPEVSGEGEMIHFSIGLLHDGPPRCLRGHGELGLTELETLGRPIFFNSSDAFRLLRRGVRLIYRCRVDGCPVVAAGPTESYITAAQRKHGGISHYGEKDTSLL